MKLLKLVRMTVLVSALGLGAGATRAQDADVIKQLKLQLEQMQQNFEKVQREQREQIEALTKKLDEMQKQQVADAEKRRQGEQLAAQARANVPLSPPPELKEPWTPAQPITLARGGSAYLNMSFDGLFTAGGSSAHNIESLEFGGHDPHQNGFTVQNLEITLDGKVDPYFRGQANIVMQIDTGGETSIEAEEAYMETTSLPWNLQVKAGQYFTQFGRLNPQHPHSWDFVDQPLVNGRFLGPDGLRNPGAQISWLAPTPFYSELFLSVQNSQGETATSFRDSEGTELIAQRPATDTKVNNLGDMLYVPRYAMSFDLTDEQTLVLGASAAFGPNGSGQNADTQIYGADMFYKWKSRNQHKGFPFVTWQTEYMYRHYHASSFPGDDTNPPLPASNIDDWGMYSQVSYGFRPGWVASLRGDYVTGPSGDFWENTMLDNRFRVSPALTFFPSEFSKIRLQYNYDDIEHTGTENSVWLQFEFLLGAHAAHKF